MGWAALLLVLGCAVRDYAPPVYPVFVDEESFRNPASAEPVAPLPTQESEAAPAVPTLRLGLADVVHEVLASDPQILAGAQGISQAQADLWTSSLLPNPTLGTGVSLFPLVRPFTVDRQGGPPQFDVGLGFPVDWLLFGKRSTAVESARAGVDVAAADFADLVRQRLADAIESYYDVLEAEALHDLAREDLESVRRLQGITEELVRLGGAGTIELDRVRVVVLDAEREERLRAGEIAIAKAALLSRVGRSASETELEVEGSLEVPSPAAPPSTDDAFRLAEKIRPDLVALRLRIEKAEADQRAAQAQAFPQVVPRVGYTRQFQEKAIGFPDVSDYGVGVDLSLPVFDRNQGNIEKARSVATQSRALLQAQIVQVRSEITKAGRDYRFAYQSVTSDAPRRIEAARNARDKIETAYRLGGRPLIDVLDAQRSYRDTQRLDAQDHAAYWKSLHRLNASVGREVLR